VSPRRPSRASRVAALVLLVAAASVGCSVSAAAAPAGADPTPTAPAAEPESTPGNASDDADDPRIVELYPNPTTEENRGEYLVVSLPERGNWSLSDGYYDARIPANASGTVALSTAPNRTASIRDGFRHAAESAGPNATGTASTEIRRLDDYFPLSTSGDRIELRRNGTAVDAVAYDRAREGYRWRAAWGEWRPRGYEPRSPRRTADAAVTPFVLPDSPRVPVEPLRAAEDRLLVAGYTLTSRRVADALVAAADRGVRVRVLLEGSPVGGFSARSARLLDRLTAAGVEVRILDGEVERFRFHHPKYAVADDDAVVLTENWKRSGTGGRSNRGWGVRVEGGVDAGSETGRNGTVADDLAALFAADFRAHDARPWREFRVDAEFHGGGRANGSYPTRFDAPPAPATADVTVLTAPGNAADRIVARIDAADERVLAVVPRVGGPDDRIVRALRRAAERGVDVHLLLSDAWYDREANRNLSEALAGEPIAVGLAEGRGRYENVHAKGLVVDDAAVVGSLNWNPSAETTNREVLLAVENESVADFYARAYAADWRGGGVHLPVGLLAGFGVALAGAGVVARRRIAFG